MLKLIFYYDIMARIAKSSAPKTFFLIVTVLVVLIVGFPLVLTLSQKPQQNQQVLQAAVVNVSIIDFQFSPATVTVPVGTTVTWTNMSQSGSMHTTSSDTQGTANSWDSGLTQKGQTFSHTFTQAGTFTYHCNVHTFMRGSIVVSGAAPQPTAVPPTMAPPTAVPPTALPTAITPTLVCVGGNGTPPCATIPPTQPITSGSPTVAPTALPTLVVPSTAPGNGNGGGQSFLALLIALITLILHLFQALGGGH